MLSKNLQGVILRASQDLLKSNSIGIITGFCIPPTETDGPLGSISVGKTLTKLGKTVTFITDESNEKVMKSAIEFSGLKCKNTISCLK